MSLRSRVKRLAELARRRGLDAEPGCRECRGRRGLIVFASAEEQPDGSIVHGDDYPAPCPACGEVAEKVIVVVEPVVEVVEGA